MLELPNSILRISVFGFRDSGLRSSVFRIRVSGEKMKTLGHARVASQMLELPNSFLRISVFGFRVPFFGCQCSVFGFRVLGFR